MMSTVLTAEEAIAAANRQFMGAFRVGDSAAIAAIYTDSGELLPPHRGVIRGRSAVEAFWQAAMSLGIARIELETMEFEQTGDTAWEVGKYSMHADAGKIVDAGKYLVIWKEAGGAWKLHRDIWNSSTPAE